MSTKILQIYQSVLNYAGMGVDEQGRVYSQLIKLDSIKPELVQIGNEQLVYPTRVQYDDPNQLTKTYFHPFSENAFRGKSEVIECLHDHILSRVNYVTAVVYQYLLVLLGSPAKHAGLNEDQIELLKLISDVDPKSAQNWVSKIMLPALKGGSEHPYVKIYLRPTGVWRGETYSRLGVVTFPCYSQLLDDKYDGLRIKDKVDFKKLFEFMFPNLQVPDTYNYGTRTRVAPYFDALMMTSGQITARLNELLVTYKNHIPDAGALMFDMDWSSYFNDLDLLRHDIEKMPDLKGNAGALSVADKKHPAHEVAQRPSLAQVPTPVPIAAPVAPAPVQQYPAAQHYPAPQTVQTPPVPAVRVSDGKINFGDIARHNPMMAMAPNPLAPQVIMGPYGPVYPNGQSAMPQQRPLPSWAQPQMQAAPPGYGQPMMQQPMMQQPQLPPLQPGYQYARDQVGNTVVVPIQQPMMQQPQFAQPMMQYPTQVPNMYPQQQVPSGWNLSNR